VLDPDTTGITLINRMIWTSWHPESRWPRWNPRSIDHSPDRSHIQDRGRWTEADRTLHIIWILDESIRGSIFMIVPATPCEAGKSSWSNPPNGLTAGPKLYNKLLRCDLRSLPLYATATPARIWVAPQRYEYNGNYRCYFFWLKKSFIRKLYRKFTHCSMHSAKTAPCAPVHRTVTMNRPVTPRQRANPVIGADSMIVQPKSRQLDIMNPPLVKQARDIDQIQTRPFQPLFLVQ